MPLMVANLHTVHVGDLPFGELPPIDHITQLALLRHRDEVLLSVIIKPAPLVPTEGAAPTLRDLDSLTTLGHTVERFVDALQYLFVLKHVHCCTLIAHQWDRVETVFTLPQLLVISSETCAVAS